MRTIFCLLALAACLLGQANPDVLSESAAQLAQQGRMDDAAALWKQALKVNPSHFPSLFNFGFMRYNAHQYGQAEELLGRAAKVRPGDFNTQYLRGGALLNLGKREDALRAWRLALAVQPKNAKLMQIMAVEYGNGRYYREGCDLARRALDLQATEANAYLVAVKVCDDARDVHSLDIAQVAIEKFPASAQVNFEYAFQLRRAGRREESVPYLQKAISLDPSYEEPYYFYGEMLLLEDRNQEAAENLAAALKIRPDYVAACVALAKALAGLEKLEEAIGSLNTCSAANTQHPQPHLLLSQLYFRLGDEGRAATEKEVSLKLRRENPTVMESPQSRPFPAEAAGARSR